MAADGQDITIKQGDRALLAWAYTGNVASGTFRFRIRKPGASVHAYSGAATGTYSAPTTTITTTLATVDSAALAVGSYQWSLRRIDTDNEETLASGRFVVESTADLP